MSSSERADVVVVGGGVVGSSIAWQLADRGAGAVWVLDVDLEGGYSSSERNAGGVRATWWQRENIELALASIEYYEQIAREVGFLQRGYLWLYGADFWEEAKRHVALQNGFGLGVQTLTPREVRDRFPLIDRSEGILGATFSPRDGLINPNLLKQHYRERARALGVRFMNRHFVVGIEEEKDRVRVSASDFGYGGPRSEQEDLERVLTTYSLHIPSRARAYEAARVVNAAGAWAPQIAALYGGSVPA
ncbi:MAG: NAD(P)/FAD-dependent oxidoreductase, partial [Vicinamibacteria bacterium]